MNKSTIILSILLGIMTLISIVLFFSMGVLVIDSENEYTKNDIEWCEVTNLWIEYSNKLLEELQSHEPLYDVLNLTEYLDCWGYEE